MVLEKQNGSTLLFIPQNNGTAKQPSVKNGAPAKKNVFVAKHPSVRCNLRDAWTEHTDGACPSEVHGLSTLAVVLAFGGFDPSGFA